MRKLYFLVLLLLPLLSIAQSNYKAGHVVNLKGDTLQGYIDYRDWGYNPKTINFKTELNAEQQQFGATDITFFKVDGYASYHAYKVTISLNTVDISSPSSSLDTAKTIDIVFLKTLQQGKNVSLYAYKDNFKERFYIQDKIMAEPVELIYGIYQNPNTNGAVYKNTYQSQLSQLAATYNSAPDKLIRQIQQSAYREDALVPVVVGINDGQETKTSSKSSDIPKFRFFAGAAFTSNTLKYSADGPYFGAEPSTSSAPKIAIGIDAFANPDIGSLIFRFEFAYEYNNHYKFADKPNPITNAVYPITSSLKLTQNIITLTPQIIYNFYNTDALKVFADLGFTVNFVSFPANEYTQYQYGKVTYSKKFEGDSDFKNYSAFQFKAGVVLGKKFEIYGAYFPGANLSDSTSYSVTLTSYQAGVNYFFGK